MLHVKNVLVPTDFSRCADQALLQAAVLAQQSGATLHLLHVATLPSYRGGDGEAEARTHDLVSWLRKMAAVPDLHILEAERRGLSVASEILSYADEIDADLVVIGTHGRTSLGATLLGSVAIEVVRHAECPVVTVREQDEARLLTTMSHVLVPVDFSEFSHRCLRKAAILARESGATLHLLHVVDAPLHPTFYASGVKGPLDVDPELHERCRLEMVRLAAEEAPGVQTEMSVEQGNPADVICRFAERGTVDLVFIATHGLTGVRRFLMGSVTEKVVRHAPCPVFVVKAFGKTLLAPADATGTPQEQEGQE
jgi:nucleotide-binding universal stress UspA family protein